MKVLVVGNGSREHAIAWKLSQSPLVSDLAVAPGNAGTGQTAQNVPIDSADIQGLRRYAGEHKVDMTVVGPEIPLSMGIVDAFRHDGMAIFGPTKSAARIESSKTFAKELMQRWGVPTAMARSHTSYDDALRDLKSRDLPVVVKADGLAAGKGVTVARTASEAERALTAFMIEGQLGEAGDRVLIEECLEGTELSVFAFVVGEYVSPMIAACDYKRVGDGDSGPNTGGMGSYSPPPFWTGELEAQVRTRIMEPTAAALAAEGCPYTGVLYAGLMLTDEGPMVIEFNCRMGDPETQAILPRLKSDLAEIMAGVVASGGSAPKSSSGWGRIQETAIDWGPITLRWRRPGVGGLSRRLPDGLPHTGAGGAGQRRYRVPRGHEDGRRERQRTRPGSHRRRAGPDGIRVGRHAGGGEAPGLLERGAYRIRGLVLPQRHRCFCIGRHEPGSCCVRRRSIGPTRTRVLLCETKRIRRSKRCR